jgi:AcrR family transcriptional regulator
MTEGDTADTTAARRPRSTTRERILEAALALFVARGVAGTTVSDIERAVGLAAGSGSFYRHFQSKDDVLVASVERAVTRMAEEVDAARAALLAIEDPAERRTGDYEVLLSAMREFDPLWRLVVAERDRFPDVHRAFGDALRLASWDVGWPEHPTATIALAALAGYNMLVALDAEPYRHIRPEDFIAALMETTTRPEDKASVRKR